MCEFVSWIEFKEKNYFLTDKDLESKEGKSLLKYLGNSWREDIKGHGAIRAYFNGGNQELGKKLQWGKEKENTDLSSPDNFPPQIVLAIKEGRMSRIGMSLDLLNDKGEKEYNKIKDQALAEYNKITDQAWAEYNKIKDQAFWEIFSQKKYRNPLWN